MSTRPKQPAQTIKDLIVGSLVLGLLGLFFSAFSFRMYITPWGPTPPIELAYYLLGAIIVACLLGFSSLYTGIRALRKIQKTAESTKWKTVAIIGIVLGIINCLPAVYLTGAIIMSL